MTVFCPSLFGDPGRPVSVGYAITTIARTLCVRREFNAWSTGASSPIVDWLRALAVFAHKDCGGRGVGAVGMCFTGNFALAMMTEPSVVAPVLSQPSLPMGPGARSKASFGVSPAEIACAKQRFEDEDLSMIGLRFTSDKLVPDQRFAALKSTFGDRFEAIELRDEDAKPDPRMSPHSVLTLHLRDDGPTKAAEDRVIGFFKARTAA